MRKLILSIAMLGSVVAAAPAMAQDYRGQPGYHQEDRDDRYHQDDRGYRDDDRGYGYSNDPSQRLRQIGVRIQRNIQAGRLSGRESYALRREYAYLVSLDRRLNVGGLTRWERRTLDQRTSLLATRLQQYRGNGYDDRGGRRDDVVYRGNNGYGNGYRHDAQIDDRAQPRAWPN